MFKVGDIVRGNKGANKYGITKEGVVGTVTRVTGIVIFIKIEGYAHEEFDVLDKFFDLVSTKTKARNLPTWW